MPIRIDNPHEVGADRLVNAVAAYERIGGACVVVDFGTGDQLRRRLRRRRVPRRRDRSRARDLDRRRSSSAAARIPRIELAEPEAAIGRSTRAAIQSGVVFGFAGLIDGIVRRIEAELGGDPTVIATGGIAARDRAVLRDDRRGGRPATLTGLRLIWERNR